MSDEVDNTEEVGLPSLERSAATNNLLLPKDKVLSLTPDEYRKEFKITNEKDYQETDRVFQNRDVFEISNQQPESESRDVNFAIAVAKGGEDEGSYLVSNEHSEEPLTVWIYGEINHVMPGESILVPAKKPKDYEHLKGVEDGTFYISTGDKEAIKVSKGALSPDLKIKHFTVDKVTPPPQEESRDEVTPQDYNSAKEEARKELELQRNVIKKDTVAYEADLKKPWANRENPSREVQAMKDEMQSAVLENNASLRWLDNPTDDEETRKLVAKRLERSAHEMYLISGLMVGNSSESGFADPSVLQENKKRAEKLYGLAKAIRNYKTPVPTQH